MKQTKEQRISEKYADYETYFLTAREKEAVELAKTGLGVTEIGKLIGLTRQRVFQLLVRAEEKQYVHHS